MQDDARVGISVWAWSNKARQERLAGGGWWDWRVLGILKRLPFDAGTLCTHTHTPAARTDWSSQGGQGVDRTRQEGSNKERQSTAVSTNPNTAPSIPALTLDTRFDS